MKRCLYDVGGFGCACSRSDHHCESCPGSCEWLRTELVVSPLAVSYRIDDGITKPKTDKERDDGGQG